MEPVGERCAASGKGARIRRLSLTFLGWSAEPESGTAVFDTILAVLPEREDVALSSAVLKK